MRRAKRSDPEARKQQILNSAIILSKRIGYNRITRDSIAARIRIASSLVAAYFPLMNDLREALVQYAIETESLEIIAQAIVFDDPQAHSISPRLKRKVMAYISQKI